MSDTTEERIEAEPSGGRRLPEPRHFRLRDFTVVLPNRWFWLAVLVSAMACSVLFLPRSNPHYKTDWSIHIWMISSIGQHLGEHHTLPFAITNDTHKLMLSPVFYSALLYSFLGSVSALLRGVNPEVLVKFLIFLMFLMQYLLVAATVRRLFGNRWLAALTGCLVTWTIYPLSNIYARGAVSEFFTTTLLVCAFCILVLFFISRRSAGKPGLIFSFFLLWTIIAGSHPITGVCGSAFLAFTLPLLGLSTLGRDTLEFLRKPRAYCFISIACMLSVAVLAPWVYATKLFLSSFLPNIAAGSNLLFYPGWSDGWLARLWPLGMMPAYETYNPHLAPRITPFLEGTINVPLLLLDCLLFATIYRNLKSRKSRIVLAAQAIFIAFSFMLLLLVSASPAAADFLIPPRFAIIQFAYRLVTYINLMLLVGVFVAGGLCLSNGLRLKTTSGLAAGLGFLFAFSFAILIAKLERSLICLDEPHPTPVLMSPTKIQENALDFPKFYSTDDYTIPGYFREPDTMTRIAEKPILFYAGVDDKFGLFPDAEIDAANPVFIRLNVAAHPWNRISIDGRLMDPRGLYHLGPFYCIRLNPGSHVVSVQTVPDATYRILRRIGYGLFALWVIAIFAYYALALGWRARDLGWRRLPAPLRRMLWVSVASALLLLFAKLFFPSGILCGALLLLSLAGFGAALAWNAKRNCWQTALLFKVTLVLAFLYGLYFLRF